MEEEKPILSEGKFFIKEILTLFDAILSLIDVVFTCTIVVTILIAVWIHSGISVKEVLKIGLLLVGMALFVIAFSPKTTRRVMPEETDIDE